MKFKTLFESKYADKIADFSKTEVLIHEYIMKNVEQAIYSSIDQLAILTGVGKATIIRYSKKLGFSSFTHLKMELFKLNDEAQVVESMSYVDQITKNMVDTIYSTKDVIDEKKIDEAAQLILNSQKLLVIGQGASNITAQDAFSRFIRIGIDTSVILDSHLLHMYTATLKSNTVLLCYTFTGETHEVVKTAKIAKELGFKIIGVTSYESSEMSKISDVCLYAKGFEKNIQGGFLSSKIAQMYVTDLLLTRCAIENLQYATESIEKATKALIK